MLENDALPSGGIRLEEYMSKVMKQHGLWPWELDMKEHKLRQIYGSEGIAPFGLLQGNEIANVPEALFERKIILDEDWQQCREMFDELYAGKQYVKVQCRSWSKKAQGYVWYEYNFSIIEYENGVPVRAIGTSRDISYQKRMEQLYCEEQKVLLETDAMLIAISRVNLSKNCVESMIVRGGEKIIPSEKVANLLDFRERVSCYFNDVRVSEKDNTELSVERLYHLYQSGTQEVETYFFARRKGQQQPICVKVNCRMLERPESGDIIAFFYNRDGTAEYVNKLAVKTIVKWDYEMVGVIFAGTGRFEVLDGKRRVMDNGMSSSVNYDQALQEFTDVMRPGEAGRLVSQLCFSHISKKLHEDKSYTIEFDILDSGKYRRKQLHYTCISMEMKLILVTQRDVHDVIKAERKKRKQLEDALNLAEKASNAKSEFLATVSHEIRTPMNVIMGMTQLVKNEQGSHEAVMEYIHEIEISSRYLLNLLNNVLDMSKIEVGEFSLHPQYYTFDDLEKSVSALFTQLCEQKRIRFSIVDLTQHPAIIVDRMRLHQIIFNLLTNAVKYTNIGGMIELIYRTEPHGKDVLAEFTVKDNGIGISKEFQKRMFKPFSQENNKAATSMQGSGLGLSIVKGIVDKMNGELSVTSEVGRGTTFRFSILVPEAKEAKGSSKKIMTENVVDFTGKRILVVDDHELNQMIIAKLLGNRGAKVVVSNNGQEAVNAFMESGLFFFDAILMDVRMPVMDGLQATRVIRSLERPDAKMVPIFAMTANAYDEDRQKSSAAGMDGHLSKPIDTKLLYRTLTSSFEGGKIEGGGIFFGYSSKNSPDL